LLVIAVRQAECLNLNQNLVELTSATFDAECLDGWLLPHEIKEQDL
jgi:hypothetical protein